MEYKRFGGAHIPNLNRDRQTSAAFRGSTTRGFLPTEPLLPGEHIITGRVNEKPYLVGKKQLDPLGDLQKEAQKHSSLRIERFSTPEALPEHIRATAERLGISPQIIVGREVTDAGEVGWLIELHEKTLDGHDYAFEATMKVEEKFKDGFGDEWPGRLWIFPKRLQDADAEVKIPTLIQELGYEVLIQPNHTDANSINIGMDSFCLTAMHHAGHLSSHESSGHGCDCAGQLDARKEYIFTHGGIEFISLADDGRGNGLERHTSQIHAQGTALKLGAEVPGSYDPAISLGYPGDSRPAFSFMYPLLARGIFDIQGNVVIPTNNGEKLEHFANFGLAATKRAVKDAGNLPYYSREGGNWTNKTEQGGHTGVEGDQVITSLRTRRQTPDGLGLRVTDTGPEDIDPEHNQEARNKAIARIKEAQAKGATHVLVLDRDEVVTWTAIKHTAILRRGLSVFYDIDTLPTVDDVIRLGGTDKAFPLNQYPEYLHLINANRISPKFHEETPLVQDDIPDILHTLDDQGVVTAVCITASPVNVAPVVQAELDRQLGMPIPAIGRPKHVSLERTAPWKFAELQRIADQVPGITLVLLDDSLSTAQYIRNKADARIQCVTLTGTLTPPEKVPDGQLATDWDHLIPTLQNLQQK